MTDLGPIMEKTHEWASKYASRKGFILNPNEEMLRMVIEGLSRNKHEHGKQYCPCRLRTGDDSEDRKIVCPCVYHEDEIENGGSCHCSLFFKV
ncbi:ferredoxin-thioredoxin reductase catalytic domain-containing protein [Methanolobus sp. ZRKC2]|uniref:ferredoxin-thioredoxin reductase catalytic domain-containing protein n=1 Tax=unclassified Methanolobus TaxID=2629569 RepID=UPI0032548582